METLFSSVFNQSFRDPRSNEYKNGFRASAFNRLLADTYPQHRKVLPYPIGSVQADAYFAGAEEGVRVALDWQQKRSASGENN